MIVLLEVFLRYLSKYNNEPHTPHSRSSSSSSTAKYLEVKLSVEPEAETPKQRPSGSLDAMIEQDRPISRVAYSCLESFHDSVVWRQS